MIALVTGAVNGLVIVFYRLGSLASASSLRCGSWMEGYRSLSQYRFSSRESKRANIALLLVLGVWLRELKIQLMWSRSTPSINRVKRWYFTVLCTEVPQSFDCEVIMNKISKIMIKRFGNLGVTGIKTRAKNRSILRKYFNVLQAVLIANTIVILICNDTNSDDSSLS